MISLSERTWRRWQAKARADQSVKGPRPRPVREIAKATGVANAEKHVAWGASQDLGEDPPRRRAGLAVDGPAGPAEREPVAVRGLSA